MKRIYGGVLALIVLFLFSIFSGCTNANTVVRWKDPWVEKSVRAQLGKPEGNITVGDLDGITSVVVVGNSFIVNELAEISIGTETGQRVYYPGGGSRTEIGFKSSPLETLADFAHFRNLERLELYCTSLSKLEGLENLGGLSKLNRLLLCANADLHDIKGISKLSALEHLELSSMDIADFDELGKLKKLSIFISIDTNLDTLDVFANMKTLEKFYVQEVPLTDLSPLEGLPNLKFLGLIDADGTRTVYIDTLDIPAAQTAARPCPLFICEHDESLHEKVTIDFNYYAAINNQRHALMVGYKHVCTVCGANVQKVEQSSTEQHNFGSYEDAGHQAEKQNHIYTRYCDVCQATFETIVACSGPPCTPPAN